MSAPQRSDHLRSLRAHAMRRLDALADEIASLMVADAAGAGTKQAAALDFQGCRDAAMALLGMASHHLQQPDWHPLQGMDRAPGDPSLLMRLLRGSEGVDAPAQPPR